jgi:hypothetical protein
MTANKGTMQVSISVSDEKVANALISAFEGGSNYWYMITKTHSPDGERALWPYRTDSGRVYPHVDYPMNPGGYLMIRSTEEPEKGEFKLDRKAIEIGLQKLANSETYGFHFGDLTRDNDDQITGDVLLQFCLFGDCLYS